MARERHFLKFPNCSHSWKRAAKLRRKAALSQAAAAGAAAAAAATTTGAAAGVAAAVGNGPPAPVSDDGGSKVDDVMGVGEDPVGEDGSGKVTVQSGWVMEDCLHHMETFSILNAGPLFEEARVKAIMPEKELASPAVVRSVSRLAVLGHMYKRMQGAAWFVTRWGLQNVVTEEDGPERKAQVDALTREGRTRYPARRQGAAAGAARRQREWDGRGSGCYRVRRRIVCSSNAAFPV
eukprot:jgi/Tetstr1/459444/TSEL_004813.t1